MNQEEQSQFEIMTQSIRTCSEEGDPKRMFGHLKRFLNAFTFGAEHTDHHKGMLGIFQMVRKKSDRDKRIAVTNWSSEYMSLREKNDDFSHDPTISLAQQATSPFTWAKAFQNADKRARKVADLCAEYTGQRDGLILPIADIKMIKGCATIGLDLSPDDFSPIQISMIHYVMTAAYARLYTTMGPFPFDEDVAYSPREREVVRALALGYNSVQISELLGIAHETTRDYIRSAKRKVGARTGPELIAKSVTKNVVLV